MPTKVCRKNILSIKEFSKEQILEVLALSKEMQAGKQFPSLEGKILASCFFEPSTRTRLSFEAAMLRLGGKVIGFSEKEGTSWKKGESLSDTMRVVGEYADILVMRHPLEGAARLAAQVTSASVINAGDGANEHPTQTLIDLFTIQESQGRLENLNIVCVGDLRFSRAVHSLVYALRHFNCRLFFVSPAELALPEPLTNMLRESGVPFSFHRSLEELIGRADILYMTRLQKERFSSSLDEVKAVCLTPALLEKAQSHLRILHPLPRQEEVPPEIDQLPFAAYFEQAHYGLFVRMALLSMVTS